MCCRRRHQLGPSLAGRDEAGQGGLHSLCMADSQAWLTSWKMAARDCGSPWEEDMALGLVAGATRESQSPDYGPYPPSLLVHLWTLGDPVAGGKGKKTCQRRDKEMQAWQHEAGLTPHKLMWCRGLKPATKVQEGMALGSGPE